MRRARVRCADGGFSLIEILISMSVSGVLIAAATSAFVVTLRVTPNSEIRIDDARSTRGLSTWLAQDTTSAPGFEPEQAQGGLDIDAAPGPGNNDCSAAGTNLLHLQWVEEAAVTETFVANYRFLVDGTTAVVNRHTCASIDATPFVSTGSFTLARGLDPAIPPEVTLVRDLVTLEVLAVKFRMTATGGDEVLVETGSRNPSDYFAP